MLLRSLVWTSNFLFSLFLLSLIPNNNLFSLSLCLDLTSLTLYHLLHGSKFLKSIPLFLSLSQCHGNSVAGAEGRLKGKLRIAK